MIHLLEVSVLLFALLNIPLCTAVRGNIGGASGESIRDSIGIDISGGSTRDAIGIDVFAQGNGGRRSRRKRNFINVDDSRGPEKLRVEDFLFGDTKRSMPDPVSEQ